MTQIEVLSLYLPHKVQVECTYEGRKGIAHLAGEMLGLDLFLNRQEPSGTGDGWVATVREAQYGPRGTRCVSAADCKPLLYDFADLATPITLADGTVVVPAVEVAKIQWPSRRAARATWHKEGEELHIWNEEKIRFVYLYPADLTHQLTFTFSGRATDYLRRLGFAVGLPANSWVRKEAKNG
jgi:hypothetical protein